MIGSIIGDILGSRFEMKRPPLSKSFDFFSKRTCFTDDTVLTLATAYALMNEIPYADAYLEFYNRYPNSGYGSAFKKWALAGGKEPYVSYGNGSAMRVSPVAYFFDSEEEVLEAAENSAKVTHNHNEGIRGAKAIALATYWSRKCGDKQYIMDKVISVTGYEEIKSMDKLWTGEFSSSCQITVPQALSAYYNGDSYESVIRNAIMFGGNADTLASMAGAIAGDFYTIPREFYIRCFPYLDGFLFDVMNQFASEYMRVTFSYVEPVKNIVAKEKTNDIDDGLVDMFKKKKSDHEELEAFDNILTI